MKQVNYTLLPAQKKFLELGNHDSDLDVSLYQGGYGSGKTFLLQTIKEYALSKGRCYKC